MTILWTGADEQELATPILSLCHGIFTDWSIFSTPFLLWNKRSSGPVTEWRQLVSCDWSWHSHGSLIQSRFDLKIKRSERRDRNIVELHAPTHRLLLWISAIKTYGVIQWRVICPNWHPICEQLGLEVIASKRERRYSTSIQCQFPLSQPWERGKKIFVKISVFVECNATFPVGLGVMVTIRRPLKFSDG